VPQKQEVVKKKRFILYAAKIEAQLEHKLILKLRIIQNYWLDLQLTV
jgi:hypothetical protein